MANDPLKPSVTLQNMRSHKWIMRRAGGNPANAESYEQVRYCEVRGIEDTCEEDESFPVCAPLPATEEQSQMVDKQCADVWSGKRCVKQSGHTGLHLCNGTQWASDAELDAISATGEVELPHVAYM